MPLVFCLVGHSEPVTERVCAWPLPRGARDSSPHWTQLLLVFTTVRCGDSSSPTGALCWGPWGEAGTPFFLGGILQPRYIPPIPTQRTEGGGPTHSASHPSAQSCPGLFLIPLVTGPPFGSSGGSPGGWLFYNLVLILMGSREG